jgi:hypothetical protein
MTLADRQILPPGLLPPTGGWAAEVHDGMVGGRGHCFAQLPRLHGVKFLDLRPAY